MRITVEISLYPFSENYSIPIEEFIERLKTYSELEMVVNATSTQIVGEHDYVFEVLAKETAQSFTKEKGVFVMKVLSFERDILHYSA